MQCAMHFCGLAEFLGLKRAVSITQGACGPDKSVQSNPFSHLREKVPEGRMRELFGFELLWLLSFFGF